MYAFDERLHRWKIALIEGADTFLSRGHSPSAPISREQYVRLAVSTPWRLVFIPREKIC